MQKFDVLSGVAAPLPIVNIDTDMIIPKQFLKTIERTGLARGLFFELRFNEDGSEKPEFVLNQQAYRKAQIIVAGDNFGCGSSREHAPWALLDYGIRCVISTSFADIFYNNCFKNGILPIRVSQADLDKLMDDANRGANATLTVDLAAQEIRGPDGGVVTFDIDPFRKHCLLEGLDDIGHFLGRKGRADGRALEQGHPREKGADVAHEGAIDPGLAEHARQNIRRTAGRKRHDDRHRTIGIRTRLSPCKTHGAGQSSQHQTTTNGKRRRHTQHEKLLGLVGRVGLEPTTKGL